MIRPGRFANLPQRLREWRNRREVMHLARQVAANAHPHPQAQPIVVFNTSSRLTGLSQNAAFTLLTSWGLRLSGTPVVHFVCQSGMSHCVLGTGRTSGDNVFQAPPCQACIRQSQRLHTDAQVYWFQYTQDPGLAAASQPLDVAQLSVFEYDSANGSTSISKRHFRSPLPLGRIVLPSVRWALRRHTLPDDEPTRYLLRQYILSALSLAREFDRCLEQVEPATALIFNGIMYPEGIARWVAQQRGVRVITQEVSFQPFSAFFTAGEATAYPIPIPDDFELSPEQNARLDSYLERRFQGQFTMAGIRFWPEMRGLEQSFLDHAAKFKQIVPVFTNVVYDTSQVHANQVFEHMFTWLDVVLEIIKDHPETLFVIRAHPDEMRPDSAKQSRESVRDWVRREKVDQLANVVFIDSQETISSYELIQRAKFVLVYNSSIGMEATLLGAAVLCAGKARYTQYPMVFYPETIPAYREMAADFLDRDDIEIPAEFQRNARRFLYYQLYRASLGFEDFLEAGQRKGFVKMKPLTWQALLPESSKTIRAFIQGVRDWDHNPQDQQHQTIMLEE